MDEILKELGLAEFAEPFRQNDITPSVVLNLNETDFLSLGIHSIGDRVRLRERCRDLMNDTGANESPVIKRLKVILHDRSTKGKRCLLENNRKVKQTRRVTIGWKHNDGSIRNSYRLVPPSKGGGKQEVDVIRNLNADETRDLFSNSYFPNGKNIASGMNLEDLTFFVATFTGQAISEIMKTGKAFTFGDLVDELATSPLRLYLHTRPKSSDSQEDTLHGSTDSDTSKQKDQDEPEDLMEMGTPSVLVNRKRYLESCAHANSEDLDLPDIEIIEKTADPLHRRSLSLTRRSQVADNEIASTSVQCCHDIPEIEILDSDDEVLQRALEQSYQESTSARDRDTPQLDQILREFQEKAVDQYGQTSCVIFRSRVLESALRSFDRKTINLRHKLFVKFSGEIGEDHGGPRREFFRLALHELHRSAFFQGPDGDRLFSHSVNLLENEQYKIVGRLVALSLAQDGPGIHFLNKQLFNLMTGQEADLTKVDHFLTHEHQEVLKQLEDVNTDPERDNFLSQHGDWLEDLGINPYRMLAARKTELAYMVKKYYLFYRTSAEIAQFTLGMNEVGNFWDIVKDNPEVFKPLFCHCPKPFTKNDIDKLCTYCYNDQGSNRRSAEEETVYAWELFLEAIEDGSVAVSFQDLLSFMTGADEIPPCGFSKSIEVHFYTHAEGETRLPHVSTCSLDLWLPRGEEPSRFSTLLLRSLKESQGFLKV